MSRPITEPAAPAVVRRGVFLGGGIGRRFLVMFLLASSLPVALLTWLSQEAVSSTLAGAAAAESRGEARAAALLTLERLRQLQVQLATLAEAAQPDDGRARLPPAGSGLRALALVDPRRERPPALDALDPAVLRERLATHPLSPGANALWIVPSRASREAEVVVAHRSASGASTWLAQVDTEWLWQDMDAQTSGHWMCVFSDRQVPLYCSAPELLAEAERAVAKGTAVPGVVVKDLFLAGDLAADNWQFVAGTRLPQGGDGPLAGALPPAAAAALLLAALLSMWQIRRTLVPLRRLNQAAHAMAAQRFDTRVVATGTDEFGALGAAFNEMASQVERQFDELSALAAIDRAVVGVFDVDTALRQVRQRLAAVFPGRRVLVARVVSSPSPRLRGAVLGPGDGAAVDTALDPRALLSLAGPGAGEWRGPHEGVPGAGLEDGLNAALRSLGTGEVFVLPVAWRGTACGLIAIAGPRGEFEADAQRHLLELRDRIAVALAAAEREDRLLHQANHDSLTGLLNRAGLNAGIDRMLAPGGEAPRLALLFVDLDRFKGVNDGLGHAVGDKVLRLVAERLSACLPTGAVLGRPAGDEFVAALPDASPAAAAEIAARLCAALGTPFYAGATAHFLGASIGIALSPEHGDTADTLMRAADIAMYQSKRRGGGCHTFFTGSLDDATQRRGWIERDLRGAAERGELRLLYQPRIDSHDGAVRSVEALLRWTHPQHGPCPPGEFIAIAEESELIESIGLWVVDAACAQIVAWRDAGAPALRVAINVSARQLRDDRLEQHLQATLSRLHIAPTSLEVEITESLLVDNLDRAIATLSRLRAMGILIALDDFGTGYSSLSSLRRLPVDVMKIDRAFVTDLDSDPSAQSVARSIVALAGALGKRIVAEGVETPAQSRWLVDLGCHELQGYLYSRPVEPAALLDYVKTTGPHRAPADALG